MANGAFGGDMCCFDGGVVPGVDRRWGKAGPDDGESRDAPSDDGVSDRLLDGDGGPADVLGGINEVDKEARADTHDFDNNGTAGRDNGGAAVAGTEGAMGSRVDVGTKGVDFEHFVAAIRTFSLNSCCISSMLRPFGDSFSSKFLVRFSASFLFMEF